MKALQPPCSTWSRASLLTIFNYIDHIFRLPRSAWPLALVLFFPFFKGWAQSPAFQCGTAHLHDHLLSENPAVRATQDALEQFILQQTASAADDSTGAARFLLAPYTLPVVIHIVHQNGPENLSDADVETAIAHLNTAFSHSGYFGQQGLGDDAMIQFCLARQTPDGLPTNGITRRVSPLTDVVIETQDLALKNISPWDPTRYINIWVVRDINSTAIGPNVGGYAFLPAAHGLPYDGIVILADGLGTEPRRVSNLAHEMGHYLGLYHTFEGGCVNTNCLTDGDRVCDTPPDRATGSACNFNSCATDADDVSVNNPFATDVDDSTWNLMDYSPSVCYSGFTPGQSVRMRLSVEGARASLLRSKGCAEPCPVALTAGFEVAGSGNLVVGDWLVVTNTSVGATQFQWFENGVLFSNSAMPTGFQLPGTGIRTLMLVVGNGDARCTDTAQVLLSVRCNITGGIVASDTMPAVGELVTFTAQTPGATNFSWTVDGAVVSSSGSFSQIFTENGYVTVRLTASNGYCLLTQTLQVNVGEVCPEYFFRQYGEEQLPSSTRFRNLDALSDGGFMLSGYLLTKGGAMAKCDAHGAVEWVKYFPESGYLNSVVSTPDGGYLVSGFADYIQTTGFVAKCTADGQPLWTRKIEDVKNGRVLAIVCKAGGYYMVVQKISSLLSITWDVFRTDENGNVLWSRSREDGNWAVSTRSTSDGGLVLVRNNSSIVKLDANGELVFAKFYTMPPGFPGFLYDSPRSMDVDGQEIYVIAGNAGIIWKTDSMGEVLWARRMQQEYQQMAVLPGEGCVVMKGDYSCKLARTDGSQLWRTQYAVNGFNLVLGNRFLSRLEGPNANRFMHISKEFPSWSPIRVFTASTEDATIARCIGVLPSVQQNLPLFMQAIADSAVGFEDKNLNLATILLNILTDTTPFTNSIICFDQRCAEICNNGLDDDYDGYVDCYDAECHCPNPLPICADNSPESDISGAIAWNSTADAVSVAGVPLVANLNPTIDSLPEIIVPAAPAHINDLATTLLIFKGDGSNADAPEALEVPGGFGSLPMVHPMVADLDHNGKPEIVIACADSVLRIFTNYLPGANPPMTLWMESQDKLPFTGLRLGAVDFDHDGIAEVYSGNFIFGLDFANPAAPILRSNIPNILQPVLYGRLNQANLVNSSIAADLVKTPLAQCIMPSNGCPDMEVVGGGAVTLIVQSAGIFNGFMTNYCSMWPFTGFGYSTTADIDNDKHLDVVTTETQTVEFCTPVTGNLRTLLFSSTGTAGLPCVANVHNDLQQGFATDWSDVVLAAGNILSCYTAQSASNLINLWWQIPIQSDAMVAIAATAFDFNGDGYDEIVLHDQAQLRVLYGGPAPFPPGVTPNRNWFAIPAPSLPFDNYAVIADVDGDLEADIVYTTYDSDTDKTTPDDRRGRLVVVKSTGKPWYPARPVWNQFNYLPVAINDDLTVPRQQQAHHLPLPLPSSNQRPLNKCLAQLPLFDSLYHAVRPLADVSLRIDSARCAAAGDSLRVWVTVCNTSEKPVAAGLPLAFYTADPTLTNATLLHTAPLPGRLLPQQCRSFALMLPAAFNQALFAVANDDGKTPRPFNTATSFPAAFGKECGYSDNIASFSTPYAVNKLDLGPDLKLCSSSTVTLNAGAGFASYRWNDGSQASNYTAYSPGTYWVEALDGCGKVYSDTLRISLDPLSDLQLSPDVAICSGDSVQLTVGNGAFVKIGWSPSIGLSCTDCADPVAWPAVTTTYTVTVNNNECIVTDTVRVDIQAVLLELVPQNPTCNTPGSIVAQTGSNGPFQFKWSDGSSEAALMNLPPGDYALTITNPTGCADSDTTALALVAPESAAITTDSARCYGQFSGQLSIGEVQGGLPPFEYRLGNQPFAPDSVFENLSGGDYNLTVRDANGCTWTAVATVPQPPVLTVTLTGDTLAIAGVPLVLTAAVNPSMAVLQQIAWSPPELFPNPNQLSQIIVLQGPAFIAVAVIDEHDCPAADTLAVQTDKTRFVFFPNVLAPGGNALAENGRFTAYGSEAVGLVRSLRVYSRWGELVFERLDFAPNDPALGWDGTARGRVLPPGVFIWTAEVEFTDGERKYFDGEVTVLR